MTWFWRFLLLFTILPLVELYLLVWLSQATSVWFTIGMILVTGLIGAELARSQGLWIWRRIRDQLVQGGLPVQELSDAALIVLGGLLLITPGVLTDLIGLALLLPPVRNLLKLFLMAWFAKQIQQGFVRVQTFGGSGGPTQSTGPTSDEIIEVEPIDVPASHPSPTMPPHRSAGPGAP